MHRKKNSKNKSFYVLIIVFFATLYPSFTVFGLGNANINVSGQDAIKQAQLSINNAYETIVLLESIGINNSDFIVRLQLAISLLDQAEAVLLTNETKAVELATNANSIALSLYSDVENMLDASQEYISFAPILLPLGVIVFLILMAFSGYYVYKYYKRRRLEKLKDYSIETEGDTGEQG